MCLRFAVTCRAPKHIPSGEIPSKSGADEVFVPYRRVIDGRVATEIEKVQDGAQVQLSVCGRG